MPKQVPWSRTDFDRDSLILEIDGTEFLVTQAMVTSALDAIPMAQCALPTGRDMSRLAKKAPIHDFDFNRVAKVPAKIWIHPKGEESPGVKWPDERRLLFQGYYVGMGMSEMYGKSQPVMKLIHQLSDLASSSTISSSSHPANPVDLSYDILHLTAGSGTEVGYNLAIHAGHDVLISNLEENVWGSIREFLTALTLTDSLLENECGGEANPEGSEKVRNLLAKISGQFRIDTAGINIDIADAMAQFINEGSVSMAASHTFWDMIVGWLGSQLKFKLSPTADAARAIAFVPGLRETFASINPEDRAHFDIDANIPKQHRAVGVVTGLSSYVGLTSSAYLGIGGCFQTGETSGVVRYFSPPGWLANLVSDTDYGAQATGVTQNLSVRSSTTPAAGQALQKAPPDERIGDARSLFDRYAQMLYAEEMLRGRMARAAGRLRFDIAPGSSIQLPGEPTKFVGAVDSLSTDWYASVLAQTVMISAEGRQCMTSYELGYVRTARENESDLFSVDEHPLYGDQTFVGAKFLD